MKVLLVTSRFPFSDSSESFLVDEVEELRQQGIRLEILPMLRPDLRRPGAQGLVVREESLLAPKVVWDALAWAIRHPRRFGRILARICHEPRHAPKNLVVVPLGIAMGRRCATEGFDHIHAHWLSTSGTLAWVINLVSGTPFSITAHRWDIFDRNLIQEKADRASFIRFISQSGKEAFERVAGVERSNLHVIHLGIRTKTHSPVARDVPVGHLRVASVGSLIPVKGHRYLVDAMSQMIGTGTAVSLDIFGEGDLREQLQQQISAQGLEQVVTLQGHVTRGELLAKYAAGCYDCVVLPSIDSGDGEHEGIPVALMEAMNHGICVVATRTGGIPELITDGESGVLVSDKSSTTLAAALLELARHPPARRALGAAGQRKVLAEFDATSTAGQLIRAMSGASPAAPPHPGSLD